MIKTDGTLEQPDRRLWFGKMFEGAGFSTSKKGIHPEMSTPRDPDELMLDILRRYVPVLSSRQRGDDWAYRGFADLVLDLGVPFMPAPLPTAVTPERPGQCFAAATALADTTCYTYVEGIALDPDMVPFDHAWCADPAGETPFAAIDPSLPDGWVVAYRGVAVGDDYRHEQQSRRGTHAVFTVDTGGFLDNVEVLRTGVPDEALARRLHRGRRPRHHSRPAAP